MNKYIIFLENVLNNCKTMFDSCFSFLMLTENKKRNISRYVRYLFV